MKNKDDMKEYVLKKAYDNNIKFIRFWFTDVQGFLKNFAITVEELEGALSEGMGFDGSSIEGFSRIEESDVIAMPDPSTFQLLPWSPKENGVARMFCDIQEPSGSSFKGDPRWVLKKTLKKAKDMGYTFYVGPELEFFYFESDEGAPKILDKGGYECRIFPGWCLHYLIRHKLGAGLKLQDIHSSYSQREKTDGGKNGEASADIFGNVEELIALFLSDVVQIAFTLAGGDDDVLRMVFLANLLN